MRESFRQLAKPTAIAAFALLAALFLEMPLFAQEQGPLPAAAPQEEDIPPVPRQVPPARQVAAAQPTQPSPAATKQASDGGIIKDAPAVPVDEIIQKFAAREAEFRQERDNFTYVQDFTIETLDSGGRPDGAYEMTSDITFTPDGKRYEQITYAPPPHFNASRFLSRTSMT